KTANSQTVHLSKPSSGWVEKSPPTPTMVDSRPIPMRISVGPALPLLFSQTTNYELQPPPQAKAGPTVGVGDGPASACAEGRRATGVWGTTWRRGERGERDFPRPLGLLNSVRISPVRPSTSM